MIENKTKPAVSVVMAAYNIEPYIGVAVESILNQTIGDLELIVVDDGSTDGTAARLRGYANRDARVKIISQDNAGLATARNVAIAHAQSDFVAIMDGDDIAHPQRLEKQLSFLNENPQYAAVACLCELIDQAGKRIKIQSARKPVQEAGRPLEELLQLSHRQRLVDQTAMIRISSLGWSNEIYRPWFRVLEDFDLSLRIAEKHRVAHLNGTPLYKYRQYPAQSTNLMSRDPVLFWHYWCAATLSAHCRREGANDPLNDLADADTHPRSFLPALAALPHPIKAACMKSARHWCRRSLRNGMSHAAEQIIDGLTVISTDNDDMRIFRRVLLSVLFYALRAGQWRYAMKVAHQLGASLKE